MRLKRKITCFFALCIQSRFCIRSYSFLRLISQMKRMGQVLNYLHTSSLFIKTFYPPKLFFKIYNIKLYIRIRIQIEKNSGAGSKFNVQVFGSITLVHTALSTVQCPEHILITVQYTLHDVLCLF